MGGCVVVSLVGVDGSVGEGAAGSVAGAGAVGSACGVSPVGDGIGSVAGGAPVAGSPAGGVDVVVWAMAAVDMLRVAIKAKVFISGLHIAVRSVRGMWGKAIRTGLVSSARPALLSVRPRNGR